MFRSCFDFLPVMIVFSKLQLIELVKLLDLVEKIVNTDVFICFFWVFSLSGNSICKIFVGIYQEIEKFYDPDKKITSFSLPFLPVIENLIY